MTAKVVPAYGMRDVGGWGIRGFRVHCPECSHLSDVHLNVNGAKSAALHHDCGPSTRELLNIVFCPTCKVDTMPSDRTGQCFFCDTQLCGPQTKAEAEPAIQYCERCDKPIPEERVKNRARYCSDHCRRRGWDNSAKGLASRDRTMKRQIEKRWLERRDEGKPEQPWKARPARLVGRDAA